MQILRPEAYEKIVERTANSWSKQQPIEWAEAEGRRYLMVESTDGGMFIQPGGLDGLNDSDVVFGCKGDNVVGRLEVVEVRRDCRIKVPLGTN